MNTLKSWEKHGHLSDHILGRASDAEPEDPLAKVTLRDGSILRERIEGKGE